MQCANYVTQAQHSKTGTESGTHGSDGKAGKVSSGRRGTQGWGGGGEVPGVWVAVQLLLHDAPGVCTQCMHSSPAHRSSTWRLVMAGGMRASSSKPHVGGGPSACFCSHLQPKTGRGGQAGRGVGGWRGRWGGGVKGGLGMGKGAGARAWRTPSGTTTPCPT